MYILESVHLRILSRCIVASHLLTREVDHTTNPHDFSDWVEGPSGHLGPWGLVLPGASFRLMVIPRLRGQGGRRLLLTLTEFSPTSLAKPLDSDFSYCHFLD